MSIWNINEKERKIKKLDKDIDIDILIIGAGITGMMTGYYLKDNKSVVIVDSNKYGHGVTLNTTAKLTYLQGDIYNRIKNTTNIDNANKYLESQILAINLFKEIIDKENIDCDFSKSSSYIFADKLKDINKLEEEVEFFKNNKVDIEKSNLPNKKEKFLTYKVNDTYTINPLKYLDSLYDILKDKVPIYENTKIIKIEEKDKYYCYTDSCIIKANKVVLACHYPFFLLPFMLPIKSYIEKSYMIVSKVEDNKQFNAINMSNPIYSVRYYEDKDNKYQISLGESHNTAFNQNDKDHFDKVKKQFNIDDKDIVMSYSNVDIITHDYMPYIGIIKKNMYISTGYNTWGMTNSILGSKIISDLINKKSNKYKELFNPLRKNKVFFLKIPIHVISQIKSYLGPKINKNKKWYKNNIKFYHKDGNSLAEVKIDNKEYIIHNKCPHLGCSLIYNEKEKTWDCPCHSSRFDLDGKCIKGPSTNDI